MSISKQSTRRAPMKMSISANSRMLFVALLLVHGVAASMPPQQQQQQRRSARSLCDEFAELRQLIPEDTMREIVVRHYKYDARFRQSMEFLRSPEYSSVAEQIEQSKVYEGALLRFEESGVDTSDISTIAKLSECLLLSGSIEDALAEIDAAEGGGGEDAPAAKSSRSMQTFSMEVMNAVPREQFRETLDRNLAKNPQFERFFKVLRSPGFQHKLMRDLGSPELAQPFSVMRRNFIDIPRLMRMAFKVLEWGPR